MNAALRCGFCRWICCCIAFSGASGSYGPEPAWSSLERTWRASLVEKTVDVRPLDDDLTRLASRLFRITLRRSANRKPFAELKQRWNAIGYSLQQAQFADGDNEQIWLLRARISSAPDEGFFAFRLGRTPNVLPLLIQAPHLNDKLTGEIVCRMFLEGSASAAAWGTSPRHTRCGECCSDLTHRTNSLFHALTIAFARVHPESRIAQIHGFSPEKRISNPGRTAGVIIASGLTKPSQASTAVSKRLTRDWDTNVGLFGSSVFELGALTNAQTRELASLHYRGFLHLEFNPFNRECLLASSTLRDQLERSILARPAKSRIETIATR